MIFSHSKLLNKFTNLTHVFTTKDSGNLAFHIDDNTLHVEQNHEALAKELNYNKNRLIHMKQIHSNSLHVVDEKDNFYNPKTCDALITNKKNTPLMVMVADCSPILFYDNNKEVIAVAHAGRAGTFKNITKVVVESFIDNFNSQISSLHVAIGPSIGVCCYEVGVEIYEESKSINLEYAIDIRDNKYYLDIKKILKKQLLELGIDEKNIDISNVCNCCNKDEYFSYRADKQTGRFSGVIKLN